MGIRAVELQSEVVHIAREFDEADGISVHFFQERKKLLRLRVRGVTLLRRGKPNSK